MGAEETTIQRGIPGGAAFWLRDPRSRYLKTKNNDQERKGRKSKRRRRRSRPRRRRRRGMRHKNTNLFAVGGRRISMNSFVKMVQASRE
jgi:hypothetical protein